MADVYEKGFQQHDIVIDTVLGEIVMLTNFIEDRTPTTVELHGTPLMRPYEGLVFHKMGEKVTWTMQNVQGRMFARMGSDDAGELRKKFQARLEELKKEKRPRGKEK